MVRKIIFSLLIVALVWPFFSQAADATLTLNQITLSSYFYQQIFDNLVLDFTVKPMNSDTLQTITIKNEGTARWLFEIEKVVLWLDNGNNKFDGFAIDAALANAVYDADNNSYVFNSLAQPLTAAGKRFFVSVETRKSGTANKTFQFAIPELYDLNGNKKYDTGDAGVFFASADPLPSVKLINDSYAMYKALNVEIWPPVVVLNNLANGQTLYGTSFKVAGVAKDQGGSTPAQVEFCVNNSCALTTNTGENFSTWEYNWNEVTEGTYSISVKSNDFNDNSSETAKISVSVLAKKVDPAGIFSAGNSSVVLNKVSAPADGVDYIKATVALKDTNNNAMADKKILVKAIYANGEMTIDFGKTSASGGLIFKWRSMETGSLKIKFVTKDNNLVKDVSTITFAEVNNFVDYTDGLWLKIKSSSAVYFLDKNNLRHAYPTQAVWESYFGNDFSSVQIISDEEMATYALGKNVPFKFGTLMKIPSVSKVYYVSKNGVLSWVPTEALAVELFGSDWAKKIKDLPESFFSDYKIGVNME